VFSSWAGSEKAFLIVRQFSTPNARIILAFQDDVSLLEEQLNVLEKSWSQPDTQDYDNGSLRRDFQTARKTIIDKIYLALDKYSQFESSY